MLLKSLMPTRFPFKSSSDLICGGPTQRFVCWFRQPAMMFYSSTLNQVAILIDFGSTFTKVVAVDLSNSVVLARSQAPSTVRTDVREGLLQALIALHERHALF